MNKNILIMASKILKVASDQFADNGCNDLDEDIKVLSNDMIMKQIQKHLGEEYNKTFSLTIDGVQDWMLMDFLAEQLEKEAETK